MSQTLYRRRAILTRIRKALDAFYLLHRIDWEYDSRATLENILAQALEELEFEGGKQIERALIIVQPADGGELEIQAGWKHGDPDLTFSRTVVHRTVADGEGILCENAKDDPRFMEAESIKNLETLSLISVPLLIDGASVGALYIESKLPGKLFTRDDLEFLEEFGETIAPYVKAALTHQEHVHEIQKLREEVSTRYSFANIVGRSESIQQVFELVRIASDVDRTVLITGESGCGKELVARAIHHNGARRDRSFVVVDCSSLSEHLLETELFGHRRGAFTGASQDKVGAFEEADGGTIFLDEISDASKPLQQKLRRVLQEGEIKRVGENDVRSVDVRVICATNRSLADLVAKGEFIRDLYFRINKFPIHIPPLRERRQDIPLLVEHFLQNASRAPNGGSPDITSEALEILSARDWSENNVRELRNTVELAVDFAVGHRIDRDVLERVLRVQRGDLGGTNTPFPPLTSARPPSMIQIHRETFHALLDRARRISGASSLPKEETPFYRLQLELTARAIIEGLRECEWKLRPAAKVLGISPTKLRYELKAYMESTLARHGGNVDRAAQDLDIPDDVFARKLRDLGLLEENPA